MDSGLVDPFGRPLRDQVTNQGDFTIVKKAAPSPSTAPKTGKRVTRVVAFGGDGTRLSTWDSKQLTEDPFQDVAWGKRIVEPPYPLEQLRLLAESEPTHAACIDQAALDIVAGGPRFVPPVGEEDASAFAEEAKAIDEWWESLWEKSGYTGTEALVALQTDIQAIGMGAFECARDKVDGAIQQLYYIPAHTLRAAAKEPIWCQAMMGRFVWFKDWGATAPDGKPLSYYASSGYKATAPIADYTREANELLLFRRPNARSHWYAVPGYIGGVRSISLCVAAREYNLLFFQNNREPRYLIIVSGLDEEADKVADDIEYQLTEKHKDPHKNLLVTISGTVDITVKDLGAKQNDLHFAKMLEEEKDEIFIAHRMPPDRLGFQRRGPLGGNGSKTMDGIYKTAVVSRGQELLENRLQRFIKTEYERATGNTMTTRCDLEELDLTDEVADTSIVRSQVEKELLTLNEARVLLKRKRHEPFGDMTLAQWLQSIGAKAQPSDGFGDQNPFGGGGDFGFGKSADWSDAMNRRAELALEGLDNLRGVIDELIDGASADVDDATRVLSLSHS